MSVRPNELIDHFVYRAWNAEGGLVYIGCSKNVEKRIREHKYGARWYPLMAKLTVDGPYSYSVARSVEREAIRTEGASHNGHAPAVMADRRRRSNFFHSVYVTATAHGMSMNEAMRHARIASDFEFEDAA